MRTILGYGGRVKARIRECGSRLELLSSGGRVIGYYDSNTDQTYYTGGKFYAYGNALMELLED